jgi:HEAT repeat protein
VAALDGLAGHEPRLEIDDRLAARLDDSIDRVRAAAVRAVGRRDGEEITARLRDLATDPSVSVQAAVAVALEDRNGDGDGDGANRRSVADLLVDPSPDVRQATIEAVAAVGGMSRGETIAPVLLGALDDDSSLVRRTAAGLLATRTVETDGVLDVLTSGSPRAQDAALLALMGHGEPVRDPVAAWAGAQIARATAARTDRHVIEGGPNATALAPDSSVGFLAAVLARRERMLVDRALGALAVLGAPEAGGVLRRCLRSTDPEIRAQALEALDSIGDRRLRGAVVRLLDADATASVQARDPVLGRLADDGDPWVGLLARRTIIEVGGMVEIPETERTISEIDTMLTLRRVPLFEGLDPEDLQRIASTCLERTYPPGAALVREGEIGDELIVIVEGGVRVVRAEPDGSERYIRRYAAGDHIGELAVLREQPRIATVIAEGDGVRAQVINGESLKAILRERPEAAMAMLSTLAERISAQ